MMDMDQERVRRQLQGHLGESVPNWIWEIAMDEDWDGAVSMGDEPITWLAKKVRKIMGGAGLAAANDKRKSARSVSKGVSEEREGSSREKAVASLLAVEVGNDPDVKAFRDEVLNGQLLADHEVESWMQQRAKEDGPATTWLTVQVPEGSKCVADKGGAHTVPPITISADNRARLLHRQYVQYLRYLEATDFDDVRTELPVALGGVLDRLRQLSQHLARILPWQEDEATYFVLTGACPWTPIIDVRPIRRSPSAASRIKMTIDPALPSKVVAEHYKASRQEVVGPRHRELSEKHIQLALFIADWQGTGKWREKMAAWNQACDDKNPKWKYEYERNFSRDCNQAVRRLLHPDYLPAPTFVPSIEPPSGGTT